MPSRSGIAIAATALTLGALGGAALLGDAFAASPAKVFLNDSECAVIEKAHPGQTCQEVLTEAKDRMLDSARDRILSRRAERFSEFCEKNADHASCKAMDAE